MCLQMGDIQAFEQNLHSRSQKKNQKKKEEQKVELNHRIDLPLSRRLQSTARYRNFAGFVKSPSAPLGAGPPLSVLSRPAAGAFLLTPSENKTLPSPLSGRAG
jgi:hypothetical protein